MRTFRTTHSGGEFFGVGARQAGWQHIDGCEIVPRIAAVAQRNGFNVRCADVRSIDWTLLPHADHLHSSPSCKTASNANTRRRGDGELLPRETPEDLDNATAICRAIAAHAGDTFSLENVWNYRTYESFDRIRAALSDAGYSYDYWHLNAADYGVPQTRRRLILMARRGLCRVQRPAATHCQGGDMFHPPWVSWYAAIADLIDALPPTTLAPWQQRRLPEWLAETMLIGANGYDGQIVMRSANQPAFTVTHGGDPGSKGNSAQWRIYLISNSKTEYGDGVRGADEPAFTTTAQQEGRMRAFLVDGANTTKRPNGFTTRRDDEPSMTIAGGGRIVLRAVIRGRWVAMTITALGRLQTVPDDYAGLTAEINSNGVPCLLARRIMEAVDA